MSQPARLKCYRGSMIFGKLVIGFQIEAETYVDQDRAKPSPDRVFLSSGRIIARYPLKQIRDMITVKEDMPV